MLPFGNLEELRGTRVQVLSQWMQRLERAGCEVTRENEAQLLVRVPGLESSKIFWDHMVLTVPEKGPARFQLDYFSGPQLGIHLLAAACFAFDIWFGKVELARDPVVFLAAFVLAQLVPAIVAFVMFRFALQSVLNRAPWGGLDHEDGRSEI